MLDFKSFFSPLSRQPKNMTFFPYAFAYGKKAPGKKDFC